MALIDTPSADGPGTAPAGPPATPGGRPRRLVVVADSDSYLKWSAALVAQLGEGWQVRVLLVASPITPSPAQVLAAAGRPIAPVSFTRTLTLLARLRPDAVLLAATGPVVRALMDYPLLRGRRRPVLVTGLPGISHPPRRRGIRRRDGCDLFVLHSHRECREHRLVAQEIGVRTEFVLATLPFLRRRTRAEPGGTDVVFAAQAKVPTTREEREHLLTRLAAVPAPLRPVVKVRALAGEQQTHHEEWSYAELWPGVAARHGWPTDRVTFRAGSMAEALDEAHGFVTVSSTAALEALHAGVPTTVLDDFGVSAEMINLVFTGSGLLHGLEDVVADRWSEPEPSWLHDNYFHPAAEDGWRVRLEELVERRRVTGGLGPVALRPAARPRRVLRRQARVLLPAWVWSAANPLLHRLRRR
ncbi:DUF6716 putative glycosyltransferase [Auraticoccus monumenti]|uniref:Uncharacterized protein n=1 Tax=Auraticoccus monumenti TaxID=675864 RepID=A0A1G7B0D0_9ACTN|nr:DUF6716 putative glycosyltransferase [Auraticoccus monumenti]SDE20380.1 hypothetical protein SAMN04489747_2788 [Auraticoccus monumenti]